jgi:hypothetical protein
MRIRLVRAPAFDEIAEVEKIGIRRGDGPKSFQ